MRKLSLCLTLLSFCMSAELDNRILDNFTYRGSITPFFTCGNGEDYSDCSEDIRINYEVMSKKIEENLGRLNLRWKDISQDTANLLAKHQFGFIDSKTITSKANLIMQESKKNKFFIEKQTKILEVETDLLKLENEVLNIVNEIELAKLTNKSRSKN